MSTEDAPVVRRRRLLPPEALAAARQSAAEAPAPDAEMRAEIARLLGTATAPQSAPAKSDAA
jgi:hypothetical protein